MRRRYMISSDESGLLYDPRYLTMEALEDQFSVRFSSDLEYRIDNRKWFSLPANTSTPKIDAGHFISFRKTFESNQNQSVGTFNFYKQCNLLGNCNSIIFGDYANYNLSLVGYDNVFKQMFSGCNVVHVAKDFLPATTLATRCYESMFQGCTALEIVPELPATTITNYCYYNMFRNCTALKTAPEVLPANEMKNYCYSYMFQDCTALEIAPELPAEILSPYCYSYMFRGCTALEIAPELPATTLAIYCYQNMFQGCTSLTIAPVLPATIMKSYCYQNMFQDCTSLTQAPALPATTLANYCYMQMFRDCTALETAPEILPATTLAPYCYHYMFRGCTALENAPILPATTMIDYCYHGMFERCSSLNYIKMLATDISASNCLTYWVYNVSPTGTFVKNAAATWDVSGLNGIPSGWTVETATE